jgi:hypothetical protein
VAAFLWVQQRTTPRALAALLRRTRRASGRATINALTRRAHARSHCDGRLVGEQCVEHS